MHLGCYSIVRRLLPKVETVGRSADDMNAIFTKEDEITYALRCMKSGKFAVPGDLPIERIKGRYFGTEVLRR